MTRTAGDEAVAGTISSRFRICSITKEGNLRLSVKQKFA
jgi:hypothetical protein